MRKEVTIGLVALIVIIIAAIGSYYMLMPQYKNVTMSGYSFEVPDSDVNVSEDSDNYNSYEDSKYNLSIKTLAVKNINDINGSTKAASEIQKRLSDVNGDNCSYENLTLMNKSGLYTYYDLNINHSCAILISSSDADVIKHIVDTLKKPDANPGINPLNMTLNETNSSNTSDISNKQVSTTKKSQSKKSSSDDGYRYSAQSGDYIKEYTDSNGIQHIKHKNGDHESYNPKTGVLTTKTKSGQVYNDYMG